MFSEYIRQATAGRRHKETLILYVAIVLLRPTPATLFGSIFLPDFHVQTYKLFCPESCLQLVKL